MAPLFDVFCYVCRKENEILLMHDEQPCCPECGSFAIEKRPPLIAVKSDCGDNRYPYVEENFGPEPIEVESSSHRRKLMKELGLRDAAPSKRRSDKGSWV